MLDTSINNNVKLEFTANLYLFPTMKINPSKKMRGWGGAMKKTVSFLKLENVYLMGMDE